MFQTCLAKVIFFNEEMWMFEFTPCSNIVAIKSAAYSILEQTIGFNF